MKRIWTGLLAAAMLLSTLTGCSGSKNAVQTVTEGLSAFAPEISFHSGDVNATLNEVFQKKPELYYYFGRYNDQSQREGNKVTLYLDYINTDSQAAPVFVVDSADTLYNVMGLALTETMEEVAMVITDSTLTDEDITEAIEQWRHDNYLVYMGYSSAVSTTASTSVSGWISCKVELNYVADTEEIQEWRQDTEEELVRLSESLFALDMPEYQRELLIHDYLVNNTVCEETASGQESYTAYGALLKGRAVCEGYAEAAHLLFQAAGLKSYYVEGAGNSSDHAWNCVQIDGDWYWVDVTWDDVKVEGGGETLSHDYFNLTDAQLNKDHSWQAASYPTCNSTVWKYDQVQAALEGTGETGESGEGAPTTFTTYSSRNVELLEDVRYQLISALGMTREGYEKATSPLLEYQKSLAPATQETTTPAVSDENDQPSASVTQQPEETAGGDETQTQNTGSQQKESHLVRNILIVVIILAVLVVAYLIYRRMMYLRMLRRRRERERARRRAAARGEAQPPRTSSRSGSSGSQRSRSSNRSGASQRPRSSGSTQRRSQSGSSSSNRRRRENPFR